MRDDKFFERFDRILTNPNPNFAKLSSLVKSDAAWETGAHFTCFTALLLHLLGLDMLY
jgi:hypothetical protein